jgi:Methyl-viologen-reducing hydrogenase, delta subunit
MTKKLLECIGIDPARIRLEWISASEAPKFAQVVRDFVKEVKGMGPNLLSHREKDRGSHTNLLKDINQIREGKTIN